jgi:hypothetical protein
VRVSRVYATAPRSDRNCSKRSSGTVFSFCEALIVGCAIVLSVLQYSIWSSVMAKVCLHWVCRTPQLTKLLQSRISFPKVASKWTMISLMILSSPANFRSSTWMAKIATNLPSLCKTSSSSSVRVGTSLHFPEVIWANVNLFQHALMKNYSFYTEKAD